MSASTAPDGAELIRRMASGDQPALELFYDRYARLVLSLAFRVLRSVPDAEEVLQEVFWQAWRSAARYDPARGTPEAWLTTLARTRAIDALRAHRAGRPGPGDRPAPYPDASRSDAPSLEDRDVVAAALTVLSPAQREALELAYYEGLTQTEIAARTGAPLGTVKTRIRSALAQLKARLAVPDRRAR